jgi:hypothetical protein
MRIRKLALLAGLAIVAMCLPSCELALGVLLGDSWALDVEDEVEDDIEYGFYDYDFGNHLDIWQGNTDFSLAISPPKGDKIQKLHFPTSADIRWYHWNAARTQVIDSWTDSFNLKNGKGKANLRLFPGMHFQQGERLSATYEFHGWQMPKSLHHKSGAPSADVTPKAQTDGRINVGSRVTFKLQYFGFKR